MRLTDRVAIVTGASSGIGRAIALALAREGAKVVVNYPFATEAERANLVVNEIKTAGGSAVAVMADVTDTQMVEALVETALQEFGRIDILVNNAGITRDNLLLRMKEEDWDAVLDTNLKGAYRTIKAVLRPMMKQRSGKIINIASVVGQIGNPGQANYAAAKAGLIGLTKTMAKELASRNITVNAIAPGFIVTPMTDALPVPVKEQLLQAIPLGKFGQPEDIAAAVVYLASNAANYVTGQTLNVDGGMVM